MTETLNEDSPDGCRLKLIRLQARHLSGDASVTGELARLTRRERLLRQFAAVVAEMEGASYQRQIRLAKEAEEMNKQILATRPTRRE